MKLPADFLHRITPPTKTAAMLAAVEADYPPGSVTATLAECLAGVLHLCDRARREGDTILTPRTLDEVIAPPLRAFLDPWKPDTGPSAGSAD